MVFAEWGDPPHRPSAFDPHLENIDGSKMADSVSKTRLFNRIYRKGN